MRVTCNQPQPGKTRSKPHLAVFLTMLSQISDLRPARPKSQKLSIQVSFSPATTLLWVVLLLKEMWNLRQHSRLTPRWLLQRWWVTPPTSTSPMLQGQRSSRKDLKNLLTRTITLWDSRFLTRPCPRFKPLQLLVLIKVPEIKWTKRAVKWKAK